MRPRKHATSSRAAVTVLTRAAATARRALTPRSQLVGASVPRVPARSRGELGGSASAGGGGCRPGDSEGGGARGWEVRGGARLAAPPGSSLKREAAFRWRP